MNDKLITVTVKRIHGRLYVKHQTDTRLIQTRSHYRR